MLEQPPHDVKVDLLGRARALICPINWPEPFGLVFVEALACGLTSIVNVLEPEVVVIGGGVSRSGEHLLAPVRQRVHKEAMTPAGKAVEIVAAALGDRVGVVGAAAIVLEHHAHDLRADA